ncbi:MAG: hypothetical protein GX481_09100, partial [Atopobium sp.]|nr:hypothetical protein [Atopobium sp.]
GVDVGKSSDGSAYSTSVARVGSDGAFHILTSALVEVAKYAGNLVELGKNSASSVIRMCGGNVSVSAIPDGKGRYMGVLSGNYGAMMRGTTGTASIYVDGFQDRISMVSGYLLVDDGTDALTQVSMRRFLTAIQPVVLYNGGAALSYNTAPGAGTTGTVTLSEDASHFTQIRIDYQYGDAHDTLYGSTFLQSPNGRECGLYIEYPDYNDHAALWVKTRLVKVSGTSITNVRGGAYAIYTGAGMDPYFDGTIEIAITKVVGWR